MHVHDVGEELEGGHHLEDRAAEVNRARVVVAEAEHPIAVVERRAVDEVHDHIAQPALEDRRAHPVGTKGNRKVGDHRSQAVAFDVDLPIARQHHSNVMPEV